LHFQQKPADIYGLLAFATMSSAFLLAVERGNFIGIVLIIFVPGYLAAAALLARKDDIDWAFRLTLSGGLSLAIVAFVGIALSFSPWGITLLSMVLSTLALAWILGLVAYWRRIELAPRDRLEATLVLQVTRWREYTLPEKALTTLLAAILVVTVPLLASALSKQRLTEPYSELYFLGPTGNFSGYPLRLNVSQPGTLQVVVTSHEGAESNYAVRVDLVGVVIVYEPTTRQNKTVELNRTTLNNFFLTLADGGTWRITYTFSIPTKGLYWVQFLLTLRGNVANPYRSVHALVTVR